MIKVVNAISSCTVKVVQYRPDCFLRSWNFNFVNYGKRKFDNLFFSLLKPKFNLRANCARLYNGGASMQNVAGREIAHCMATGPILIFTKFMPKISRFFMAIFPNLKCPLFLIM